MSSIALPLRYRVALKIVKSLLQADNGPPPAFIETLAQSLLQSNSAVSINSTASALAQTPLLIEALVHSLVQSNTVASIDAIAGVLARTGLSSSQAVLLLRSSLGNFRGTELPHDMLDCFEEISGACLHYSQEGEDIVLDRILPQDKVGFFVDVGAHHPLRFSNTYALYRKGWRGINLDATPGSMAAFNKLRPEDINIECAISDADNSMTFHVFKEGALNTFDASLAKEYVDSDCALERTVEIRPHTLSSILDEYLPAGKHIDLLNIDVEGEEMGVLRSNNWLAYRPSIIILEVLATPYAGVSSHPTVAFLADKGYEPVSRLTNSVILRRET